MSTLKASVELIDKLDPHPNADRLELATVLGWQCVVQKDRYKAGDKVVYIPIDSILPEILEASIFGADSKIRLNKHRVKTIKLRGAISQGLVVDLEACGVKKPFVGDDLTSKLGITKHEPPAPGFQGTPSSNRSRRNPNPHFHKYTSIENIKNYNKVFEPGDEVIITEKIHGTNFRAGWVPFDKNTLWKKFKGLFGLNPKFEFVYGSHNVQLSGKLLYKGWYDKNVYAEAVVANDLKEKLSPGQILYGEIYGPNIQKGYGYGLKDGQRKLVIFDIIQDGEYLDSYEVRMFGTLHSINVVPVLYEGKFGKVDLNQIVGGKSVLCPEQKVREGVVVRPDAEQKGYMGRVILKAINPEYLLKEQTEYH